MSTEAALGDRIRELRRRHFGAQGRARFAAALAVSDADVERFERGVIPAGELLVRMCELTGEDLQWLLTGQAARSTMVIAGARTRHSDLLARIAETLDRNPATAAPIQAFVELLDAAPGARLATHASAASAESESSDRPLLPILDLCELPDSWNGPDGLPGGALVPRENEATVRSETRVCICEPDADAPVGNASIVTLRDGTRAYLRASDLLVWLPDLVAVAWRDDSMRPMFASGDALLVSPSAPPRVGLPALCRRRDGAATCRIWLGDSREAVELGRLGDGGRETIPSSELSWAAEVLYRVAAA